MRPSWKTGAFVQMNQGDGFWAENYSTVSFCRAVLTIDGHPTHRRKTNAILNALTGTCSPLIQMKPNATASLSDQIRQMEKRQKEKHGEQESLYMETLYA
jgi:hypothetical protein